MFDLVTSFMTTNRTRIMTRPVLTFKVCEFRNSRQTGDVGVVCATLEYLYITDISDEQTDKVKSVEIALRLLKTVMYDLNMLHN